MKRLTLAITFVLVGLTTYASVATYSVIELSKIAQDDYIEVSPESVPVLVQTALSKAYPSAKLVKAYVNDKKEYKLEIEVEDQKATVYAAVAGNWLKI
ncbi:hypothetical protein [Flavobacterium sp. TAB 87]|uniref:hypothetical protein n=1 Tax=Flavobacterium sp. TAB 87 TaxID=1729581 RepID=UPI00076D8A13|nr:hypothetical protein [Flavobacterium sp. TAB 87]KVV13223.1 hypothetical protein AP058_02585 [Flavobacterium sp. TAB 87]